jgi:tetratricopeptide (TPR) repeat protein
MSQLDALLAYFNDFYQVKNNQSLYGTDDVMLETEAYDRVPTRIGTEWILRGSWDTGNFIPNLSASYSTWTSEYSKIYIANTVLTNLDQVSGGTAEDKARIKGEAHLARAYSMMEIVNAHCLPYTEFNKERTKDELGRVIKKTVSFDEGDARATLEATHALIESDLEEALKLTNPLVVGNRVACWRGNIGAANAVAARYWLSRGDYSKALGYAEAALGIYSTLIDYNSEMYYGTTASCNQVVKIYPNNDEEYEEVTLRFPYTYANQTDMADMIGWKEFYYFRLLYHGSWWFAPSKELVDTYDRDNDLRYKYHMIDGYSYISPVSANKYPAWRWWGYVHFFQDRIVEGPTTAEMILTKAECQARTGDFGSAMQTVNQLRAKRIINTAGGDVIDLTAGSQQEAVTKILAERRREMPIAMRWFDARRLNNNDVDYDDITFTHTFYRCDENGTVYTNEPVQTYTLDKNSRRWADPVPNSDVVASGGVLRQNTY